MLNWRKATTIGLVICVVHLCFLDSVNAAASAASTSIKQNVDQFGVGAKVGVTLATGKKLRGFIEAIEDRSFLLDLGPKKASLRVGYDEVTDLRLAKRKYRASEQPDAVEARRVALALGVDKHVVVKTSDGRERHGHIRSIEADYFTILPDHQSESVQIAYNDVRHLEKNLSAGATIVLVVVVAAAVVVTAILLADGDSRY
jgi:small nuclear ribonucleoprotein (snRNP)-like protein